MIVSNFELIYKPQAPVPPIGVPNVETVFQGYFLTITNLEDEVFSYRVEFCTTPPAQNTPNRTLRSLAGNTVVFVDSPGSDNVPGALVGNIDSNTFRTERFVRIQPKTTALIAVLPSAFNLPTIDPTPITNQQFEVRGFVRLTLPALVNFPGIPFFRAQSDRPVRVLVTPQQRSTFLTPSPGDVITDQVLSPLPIASGAAENLLQPETGVFVQLDPAITDARLRAALERLGEDPDLQPSESLLMMLAQLDPDGSDLRGFNKMLSESGVPFAIERRKLKQ